MCESALYPLMVLIVVVVAALGFFVLPAEQIIGGIMRGAVQG
ncbi:hypothetical protein [Microbispora bryophytorum]